MFISSPAEADKASQGEVGQTCRQPHKLWTLVVCPLLLHPLRVPHILSPLSLPLQQVRFITPILERMHLGHTKIKELAQGDTAGKWQSYDSTKGTWHQSP